MRKQTKAEKWFGKRQKDLTKEELKKFYCLVSKERRKKPEVKEYYKQYKIKYRIENREKINKSNREYRLKNPEKFIRYNFKNKITFTIEKLEKVKEVLDSLQPPPNYPEFDCEYGFDNCLYQLEDILDQIQGETK